MNHHYSPHRQYRPSVLLQATCLKPQYSLRRQLLVSFGATSVLSIVAVLVMAISGAHHAGEIVKDQAHDSIRDQVITNLQYKSIHIADIMSRRIRNIGATTAIMAELTRDRIVGYPNDGYEDDLHVPFHDAAQGRNIYPLKGDPLPFNWDIVINVNDSNYMEHVQERWKWYNNTPLSTVSSSYGFQGICDPNAEPNQTFYSPNCSEADNNVTTGGNIKPTPTNQYLYDKSAELGLFLKPLWESVPESFGIGIYFYNSGAGSRVSFPPRHTTNPGTYFSTGCDYLNTTNIFTGRPLGTAEEIARCHPAGTEVPELEYNNLERPWCREQVLTPNRTTSYGPYLNVGQGLQWLITIGRSVFDRRTGEFIACTLIDVAIEELVDVIQNITTAGGGFSTVSLVDWQLGTVVAGPFWDARNATETIVITETGLIDQSDFDEIRSALNFSKPWDPNAARKVHVLDHGDSGVITAYPVPGPPAKYDPTYYPKYMVLFHVDEGVFQPIRLIQHSIDNDVAAFTRQTICVGIAFGFILVMLVIWLFVRVLTRPLLWMQSVAWSIVNHSDERVTGDDLLNNNNYLNDNKRGRCAPKTEITALVSEFRKMIHGFSRDGAATVAPCILNEITNRVTWQDEFIQLYTKKSRRTSFIDSLSEMSLAAATTPKVPVIDVESAKIVAAAATEAAEAWDDDVESTIYHKAERSDDLPETAVTRPIRMNKERLLSLSATVEENQLRSYLKNDLNMDRIRVTQSPLFWWILVSFVMPLTICFAVVYTLGRNQVIHILPTWMSNAESVSLAIQYDTINAASSLRASYIEAILYGANRDLHLFTRFAGWLLFDGIRRSDSFTAPLEATEECKNFSTSTDEICPFLREENLAICDCTWADGHGRKCTDFGNTSSRQLQQRFFAAQAKGADKFTGDRYNSTNSKRPDDTFWWNNTKTLPGADQGVAASGYNTIYDRVRVSSALATVEFPIYNFAGKFGLLGYNLGTFVAFEADGLMTGYDGCGYNYADYAQFQSNDHNLAFEIDRDLCPAGSYGYDPRCREWFAIGKNMTFQSKKPLYVAPPLVIFGSQTVASKCTSPLTDPRNGKYIGQTLLQFSNIAIASALDTSDVEFSFVITPTSTFSGGDTVVVSGMVPAASVPISDVILPFDSAPNSSNQVVFAKVIADMKDGKTGNSTFSRTRSDGTQETLLMVYSPISLRSLQAVRPDDYSRGLRVSQTLVYSLAVASEKNSLYSTFKTIEKNVFTSLERKSWVYTASIVSMFVIVCAFTCLVASSITKPVIILLRAVRNINAGRIEDDIPPMQGGSREVNQVYNSFAKLYKIVRFSNSAFFSGNLDRAFHFINEALVLFGKVDDKKAIGIASNNLGNTLLAMYREKLCSDLSGKCCCHMDGNCVVRTARQHLDEAVRIATLDFDQARSDDVKAEYATQLANRLFNRAMLCLISQRDPCSDGYREQGYKDLLRAKQLDCDVRDFWMARMLVLKNSEVYFNRLIGRIRGLVDLYDDETVRLIWNAKEVVDETDRLLFAAWNEVEAPMFRRVTQVGRLQQLEEAAIRLELALNNTVEAARLGMRMFVEDEFVLESSFVIAATAVLTFATSSGWTAQTAMKRDLRKMAKACKSSTLDLGRSFVFCFELSNIALGQGSTDGMAKIAANALRLFDQVCGKDDCVGLVCGNEDVSVGLKFMCEDREEQRQRLQTVAEMRNGSEMAPSFPSAVRMATAAIEKCMERPIFLVAIVDGSSWDVNAFGRLRDQLAMLHRTGVIHVILVGVELPEHVAEQCRTLSRISKTSAFVRADIGTIDEAFEQVASLIRAGRGTSAGSVNGGVTMEKF